MTTAAADSCAASPADRLAGWLASTPLPAVQGAISTAEVWVGMLSLFPLVWLGAWAAAELNHVTWNVLSTQSSTTLDLLFAAYPASMLACPVAACIWWNGRKAALRRWWRLFQYLGSANLLAGIGFWTVASVAIAQA